MPAATACTRSCRITFFRISGLLLRFCSEKLGLRQRVDTPLCITLIYVERRNLTVSLPTDTIRKARVYAAQHDMTLNRLVQDLLEEAVQKEDRTRAAYAKLLELAEQGPYSNVDPGTIRRDELHERW